jgi:hypothetical protein
MFEIETNVLLSCFFNIIFEYSLSFINMLFCSHLVKKKKKFMYCRFSSPTSTCCFFIFFRRFFCILKTHAYSIRSKKKKSKYCRATFEMFASLHVLPSFIYVFKWLLVIPSYEKTDKFNYSLVFIIS